MDELASRCSTAGLDLVGCPVDESAADQLAPHVAAFRLDARFVTHHPLVQHLGRKSLPVLVSTGDASPEELRELDAAWRAVTSRPLVLVGAGRVAIEELGATATDSARAVVVAHCDIAVGEALTRHNLAIFPRRESGLHPRAFLRALGCTARQPTPAGTLPSLDAIAPLQLGDRVALRPLGAEDTDRIVAWRNRPEVAAQLFSPKPPSRDEHEAWRLGLERRFDRVELVILDDDHPVGTIGLSGIDFGAGAAEYGILLGETVARGRGVATRASQLLLDYAFGALALGQVRLELFADNAPARRLYDRLGFVADPSPPAPREKDGRLRAVTTMRLDADRWTALRRGDMLRP
jgi:RimJ/RimL family protein N-acetyltransferase